MSTTQGIQTIRDGLAELGFTNYEGVWLRDVDALDGKPAVRWEEGDDDWVTLEIDGGYIVMTIEQVDTALVVMRQAHQVVAQAVTQ